MAKIQRKTQKIFAGQSPVDEKAVFGTMKTGTPVYSNDVEQLQSADYEQGWQNGIVTDMAPFLEEMNGVQYGLSSQIAYLLQQGVAEWDAETTYYLNSFCQYGGVIYRSLEDENTGNNPSTSSSWLPYNTSSGELDYNQVTNCILSSQGGTITKQDYSQASYVNKGCTISEANVASGFSASNYILLSKTMTDANSFSVEIPLTLNGTEGIQVLVAINNYDNSLCIEDGKLVLHYDGNRLEGDTVLTASTSYTVKFERTSSGYTVQLKTGGGEYEPEINLSSTIGYYGGKSVYLGSRNGYFLNGTIDLTGVKITSDNIDYWTLSMVSEFQTVTVQGTFQLLMPDGRNADLTLNNESMTLTIDDVLLYSPSGMSKTIVVTNEGELMIRDFYAESYEQPSDIRLNGVWFDKTSNMMKTQLNTYPNFLSVGNIVVNTSGKVEGFSADSYVGLPSTYSLGSNWSFAWGAEYDTTASGEQSVVFTPTDDGDFQSFEVIQNGTNLTAKFRRSDVFVVNKEVVTSTAYGVQKTDTSSGEAIITTGYVQASGSGYVSAGTQIYSDSAFETPLEEAASDTWSYTGESVENTELVTGYTKVSGATLVPADTVIYSDANCTSVQGSATGTDYTYSGSTAESIICTLSDTVTGSGTENVTVGYNGSNYFLNDETYTSTDLVNDDAQIMLGSDGVNSFKGSIELEGMVLTTPIEQWQWNGVNAINPNITTYGTLTNDNGVFSGFNSSNYLIIPQSFGSTPWVYKTKIHTPATLERYNDFCGSYRDIAIGIVYSSSSPTNNWKLNLAIDTDSKSGWDYSAPGTVVLQPNTDYWIEVAFTGTAYTLSYSTTGEEDSYILDNTYTSSTPLDITQWAIGIYATTGTSTAWFDGSIDLNETTLTVNNELVWSWNGLTSSVADFVPFVGAKIGEVVDGVSDVIQPNIDIYGTPTFSNGIVSGFSQSSYATTNVPLPSTITSYEIVAKFTTGVHQDRQEGILANSVTNVACPQIAISSGGNLFYQHPVNAETWTGPHLEGIIDNTTYWARFVWNGSTVSAYYKTMESADYTLVGTADATTINWVEQVGIGIDQPTNWFPGSIDLNESYININGKLWWRWNGLTQAENVYSITDMSLDLPLSLAKDTDVVHSTGNELVEGIKTFQNRTEFNGDSHYFSTGQNSYAGIAAYNNNITYEDFCNNSVNGEYVRGGRILSNITNDDGSSWWFGYTQADISHNSSDDIQVGNGISSRVLNSDGTYSSSYARVYINKDGKTDYFRFPKCTTAAGTTSTASSDKVCVVVANYRNGTSWYRVWSDGWIEQGGRHNEPTASNPVQLLRKFKNTNYCITTGQCGTAYDAALRWPTTIMNVTTSSFVIRNNTANAYYLWYACGY